MDILCGDFCEIATVFSKLWMILNADNAFYFLFVLEDGKAWEFQVMSNFERLCLSNCQSSAAKGAYVPATVPFWPLLDSSCAYCLLS